MKHLNTRWYIVLAILLLAVSLACNAGLSWGERAQEDGIQNEDSTTVNVSVKDFSFSLDSSQAVAGTITFRVNNNDSANHDFAIRGNGVSEKTRRIKPGESATLTVELEPGTYTYVCTIPGHEQRGMRGSFTVTSS